MNHPRQRTLTALLLLSTSSLLGPLGCREILDIPELVECGSDDACNTEDTPCVVGECIDGACAYSLRPAGTVIDEAEEDDCLSHVCDDAGELVTSFVDDAPPDATAGDCLVPTCVDGVVTDGPADDVPADATAGDCLVPTCVDGVVTDSPGEDAPADEVAGDCSSPLCDDGAVVDGANDDDAPSDDVAGDCSSPVCQEGAVVDIVNEKDTPAEDITGDCLAPTCAAGGGLTPDDADVPSSGCGSCAAGVVVPWAEVNTACYTGAVGTQGVGVCVGGIWTCTDNMRECAGERVPASEACGPGFSGFDEDCDNQTDEEGVGCACVLGTMQACYTGPGGTQNVGTCDDGTSTCVATMMGNQFGSCVGEVLPEACDSCLVNGDEDCSGSAESCLGTHVWSKSLGSVDPDFGSDVLQLPNGDVLAVGYFLGTLVAGSTTLISDGSYDAYWLRRDADGNALAAKDWGGSASDSARSLTLLDDGYLVQGVLANGSSENFGSGATFTAVGADGFLAKFNFSHSLVWKKQVGGTMNDSISAMARMPDNGVVIAGQFQGTINLGGAQLNSLGFDDIFVARYDAAGNHVWSNRYGTNMQNSVADIAVGPNGDIVIVGDLGTSMAFGSGPTITVQGGVDSYIVKLDQNGSHVWTRAWQSTGNEYASGVGILSDGSVWAVGKFDTAVNVNGTSGSEQTPTGTGYDMLLVKYDAAGTYLASKAYNSTDNVYTRDVEVGEDDSVVISGGYSGTLFFGTFAAPAVGGVDTFIVKINNNNGNSLWSKKVGGTGTDYLSGVDVGACGDVFTTGYFTDSTSFGGGNLPNAGGFDVVIAKYRQ